MTVPVQLVASSTDKVSTESLTKAELATQVQFYCSTFGVFTALLLVAAAAPDDGVHHSNEKMLCCASLYERLGKEPLEASPVPALEVYATEPN